MLLRSFVLLLSVVIVTRDSWSIPKLQTPEKKHVCKQVYWRCVGFLVGDANHCHVFASFVCLLSRRVAIRFTNYVRRRLSCKSTANDNNNINNNNNATIGSQYLLRPSRSKPFILKVYIWSGTVAWNCCRTAVQKHKNSIKCDKNAWNVRSK